MVQLWSEPLRAVFAERAFARVQFCIDSVPDVQGQKSPWRVRKDSYLEYPRKVEGEAGILVSSCDKLANLLAILLDLTETGEAVRARLKGGKGGSLSYYSELASMFSGKVLLPVEEALKRDLAAVLERLQPAETWEFLGDSVFVIHVFFITFADDCIHAGGSDVGRGLNGAFGNADGGHTYGYRSPGNGDESASVTPEGHGRGQG